MSMAGEWQHAESGCLGISTSVKPQVDPGDLSTPILRTPGRATRSSMSGPVSSRIRRPPPAGGAALRWPRPCSRRVDVVRASGPASAPQAPADRRPRARSTPCPIALRAALHFAGLQHAINRMTAWVRRALQRPGIARVHPHLQSLFSNYLCPAKRATVHPRPDPPLGPVRGHRRRLDDRELGAHRGSGCNPDRPR